MKITFPINHIVPELKGTNGLDVIDELINHLVGAGTISAENREPIAAAIKQRERSMSTGIGLGIALPHGMTHLLNDVVVAFGRSSAGVDFDALDRQPVRVVALMIVPAGQREKHLKTLTGISRLLHDQELRNALEVAPDAAAIAQLLNERATDRALTRV